MTLCATALRLGRSRALRYALAAVLALAGLFGVGYYLTHHYDPVRVIYKRLKAPDPYRFETIHPRYRKTDPAALITVRTPEDARRLRDAAVRVIWGAQGLPRQKMPEAVERDIADERLAGLPNLERIDRLRIVMDRGVFSIAFHLHPRRANGRLVLYHHGYAGTFHDAAHVLAALLDDGYAVIAFNYLGYGENWSGAEMVLPRIGRYWVSVHRLLDLVERPMAYFFEPVVVALNYAERDFGFEAADMIGFSAGGWTTMVTAALDPRIRRSYPVAGGYPLYLRSRAERNQSAPPQYYGPLVRAMNYLEAFVLGASGEGRRQLQVFNRYDRCCFRNTLARLYEPAVRAAVARLGPGGFEVLIDETHADHKVSAFAVAAIMRDLARP